MTLYIEGLYCVDGDGMGETTMIEQKDRKTLHFVERQWFRFTSWLDFKKIVPIKEENKTN
ncbi:hypothetical protein TorRG33x02_241460 [Trema orientale]|uniref:Uncharacterized protein n=1 Tax=Trema orientale TaxID=63057 RepID=A0A2P5DUI8_TREOI|nr:hypothetical protein TorRG33x02_241460 [Trema orientale]